MIGADKLHNEGYYGAGVKIGVLDTGLDYTHPAFGNCWGKPGCTVVGGYSFVSDSNTLQMSPDPKPDCGQGSTSSSWGHGTNVAGVIGAHGTHARNFTGIVPQAQLSAYRIAGCTGVSAPDISAAAFQKAFYDGMDIASMSYSYESGWQQAFLSQFVTGLTKLGLSIVLSMGNGGEVGLYQTSSPAVAAGAYAIASVQNSRLPGWTFSIKPNSTAKPITAAYLAVNAFTFKKGGQTSFPVYTTSKKINDDKDACGDLPDSTPDLSKYAVLVHRSKSCNNGYQVSNLEAKGAKIILLYNNEDQEPVYADELVNEEGSQGGMLTNADGVKLAKLVAAGGAKVTVDFSQPQETLFNNTVAGGLIGSYSEYSPSWDGAGLPGSAGVGGQVLSTWPVAAGSYAVLEGTSFACPQVAGALALYKSIKGSKESPQELQAIFTSTANPVPYSKNASLLNTVAQAGGGLIDVYKAVKTNTRVSPYQLLLNDTRYFQGSQKITVKNVGNSAQTFTMGHLPAGTVYGQDTSGKGNWLEGPLQPVAKDQASVKYNPSTFTLAAGQSRDVQLTFTPPKMDSARLGVYSGYVQIKSDKGALHSLTVPYLGLGTDLSRVSTINVQLVDGARQTYLQAPQSSDPVKPNNPTYDLDTFDTQPRLISLLNVGSPLTLVQLVRSDTKFVPTYRAGGSTTFTPPPAGAKNCPTLDTTRDLIANVSQAIYTDRPGGPSYTQISRNWTDAAGVVRQVPEGSNVRVLLRALRPNADAGDPCSYESWLSNAFNVRRK